MVSVVSNSPVIALPSPAIRYPARLISDLHLGHDVCSILHHQQLEPLLDGISTLILNGDTFEARIERFRPASQRLLDGLLGLCAQRGVTPVLLNGNHDPASWSHDSLELFGGKFVAHHGHAFFRNVSPWSAKLKYCQDKLDAIWADYTPEQTAQVATRYDLARRCSLAMLTTDVKQANRGLLAKLAMAARELWPPKRPWLVAKIWLTLPRIAGGFLDEYYPQAEVFCFGHTHRAASWNRRNRLLINTGAFISFARQRCVDITESGDVAMRKIDLVRRKLPVPGLPASAGVYVPGKVLERKLLQ